MKKLSLKILWKRLCLETPSFFKRVKLIGASLGATSLLITTTYGDQVPVYLNRILEFGVVAGAVSILIAQFAVENPKDLHKDKS